MNTVNIYYVNYSKRESEDYGSDVLSPLDGRYRAKLTNLRDFFSETSLYRSRIQIELKYILFLSEKHAIPRLSKREKEILVSIEKKFDAGEYVKLKEIERMIRHDVKAVEYYLRKKLSKVKLDRLIPFLHIGLTSDDINNLAFGLMFEKANRKVMIPVLQNLMKTIKSLGKVSRSAVILGRTHGQPAVPTTVGKELVNYYYRLRKQSVKLFAYRFEGKLNGAVGNFNAHAFVFPDTDWIDFSERFVKNMGLLPSRFSTQILFYDNWVEYFQILSLCNSIIEDFCLNVWLYIMNEVFSQKNEGTVGSSTMPQKINPIDFERAEGNAQTANGLLSVYVRELPLSRLQRDLSDSTIRRTFGCALGYTVLAWQSAADGLKKISVNSFHIKEELDSHWEILSEALQTYLRVKRQPDAYEKIKSMFQGKTIGKEQWLEILKKLKLSREKKLTELEPEHYTGLAEKLVSQLVGD